MEERDKSGTTAAAFLRPPKDDVVLDGSMLLHPRIDSYSVVVAASSVSWLHLVLCPISPGGTAKLDKPRLSGSKSRSGRQEFGCTMEMSLQDPTTRETDERTRIRHR